MAAMLSLTPPKPTANLHHQNDQLHLDRLLLLRTNPRRSSRRILTPISAASLPPPGQVYQPFRPPPSPLPAKYKSLDLAERLEILQGRLGLWHEYAPLISSIAQDGFTLPSIEEITGITGVEQNRLVVAAQVRDSLISSSLDPDLLAHFDSPGGAELLYELRLLNGPQRAATAQRVVDLRLDPKAAQELARAVKDFPRRRGDDGWDRFTAADPGDCLAFAHFRLSREALSVSDRVAALEKAMDAAETEGARARIVEEMERATGKAGAGAGAVEDGLAVTVTVPVVRLQYGEVAEATTVALLPVCVAWEGEAGLRAAPGWCRAEGELGVVMAEKGWGRWVVLPRWEPVVRAEAGIAVEFADSRVLPWRVNRWVEEAVLVVADRGRREVADDDGFYVVGGGESGGLVVERGGKLLEKGVGEALAVVVMVVRPPREEEEDQLGDEDWV